MPAIWTQMSCGALAADHLRPVVGVAQDQLRRNDPLLEDRALAVHVLEEQVQRLDPLGQARLELAPFGARDQARHDVERDQALGRVLVAVDAEGDADAAEHVFGLGAAGGEQVRRRLLEPARHLAVERARRLARHAPSRQTPQPPPCRYLVPCATDRPPSRLASQLPCRGRAPEPRRPASPGPPAWRRNRPRSSAIRPA